MVFSSLVFLWLFLPFTLIVNYLLKNIQVRNTFLLLMSLLFYAWGEPRYVVLMVISILINYTIGLQIGRSNKPKFWVAVGVLFNLSFLGYFKYINFAIDNINKVLGTGFEFEDVSLPIGISFYTFQALSYVVDVYRGQVKAQENPIKMGLYISFFPQLIAGPIVKYYDIEKQIDNRKVTIESFNDGVVRFIIGLFKKVMIANILGGFADQMLSHPAAELSIYETWISIFAYALQIYYDFSGYSDMAIGLGLMFGFRFQENFNFPYISQTIKEYWRRWHISLSTWFKEYLYIPLGGNRKGTVRTYVNLLIVFFCTGLWHGASWNFVIWGMWHGLFLVFERLVNIEKILPLRILRHIYIAFVVLISYVFFRIEDLHTALTYIGSMFDYSNTSMGIISMVWNKEIMTAMILGVLMMGILPSSKLTQYKETVIYNFARSGALILMFYFCVLYLAGSSYNPFIYFRF